MDKHEALIQGLNEDLAAEYQAEIRRMLVGWR